MYTAQKVLWQILATADTFCILYYHKHKHKATAGISKKINNHFQCFDAVGWVAGRASGQQKTEWWDSGMVICLRRGAHLHTAQLMPLPLTNFCSSKSRLVLPFWYQLTQVVPDKIQGAVKWMQ